MSDHQHTDQVDEVCYNVGTSSVPHDVSDDGDTAVIDAWQQGCHRQILQVGSRVRRYSAGHSVLLEVNRWSRPSVTTVASGTTSTRAHLSRDDALQLQCRSHLAAQRR